MKKYLAGFCTLLLLMGFTNPNIADKSSKAEFAAPLAKDFTGAWKLVSPSEKGTNAVRIIADGYFAVAYFDKEEKKFSGTYGGTLSNIKGKMQETIEFDTWNSNSVGTAEALEYKIKKGQLLVSNGKGVEVWEKVHEAAQSPFQGTWIISGRADEVGLINNIPRGPRKTIKIMSGNRFQWIAYNTETKEFFGTGGGMYGASEKHYTETIEFFSRDATRVGMSLTFNCRLDGKTWRHFGNSSTGKEIHEIWKRD